MQVQDFERSTYLLLRKLIEAAFPPGRAPRIRAVGGNHDIVADVASVFPATDNDDDACAGASDTPSTCFVEQAAKWLVLGFDTVDARSPHGGAGGGGTTDEELRWLEQQLAASAGRSTVIFMHHPPVPCE